MGWADPPKCTSCNSYPSGKNQDYHLLDIFPNSRVHCTYWVGATISRESFYNPPSPMTPTGPVSATWCVQRSTIQEPRNIINLYSLFQIYAVSGKCQRRGEFLKHSKHLKILSPSLLLLLFCTWMPAFPPKFSLPPWNIPCAQIFFPSHVPFSLTFSLLCKSISHSVLYHFFPLFYSIPRLNTLHAVQFLILVDFFSPKLQEPLSNFIGHVNSIQLEASSQVRGWLCESCCICSHGQDP